MALEALKRNGHNLQLGGYETDGPYGIPRLAPATLDGTLSFIPVSYTHLRAHETGRNLVCRLLLEKKKKNKIH